MRGGRKKDREVEIEREGGGERWKDTRDTREVEIERKKEKRERGKGDSEKHREGS